MKKLIVTLLAGLTLSAHAGGIDTAIGIIRAIQPQPPPPTVVIQRTVIVHQAPQHNTHHKALSKTDAVTPVVPQAVVIPLDPTDTVVPAKFAPGFTDTDSAAVIVKDYLANVSGSRLTLAQTSAFAHIRLATYDYIVAEIEVNSVVGIQQFGFIYDVKTQMTTTRPMPIYHAFLHEGGNRTLIGLHDLNALD
jgi:hypothetical protein